VRERVSAGTWGRRLRADGTIVTAGHPGLVDTVLVAGRVVKRDGMLVDVDLAALRTRLFESRNRIAAAAGIPLDGTWRPRPES
jgi:5-methylthioadenosine/S-adenosylhomocysteine deaminase